ncbi:hypothetical protein EV278_11815 [Caulobacter sp. BK020]|nr:hypothetical protein EV278_11815 [Caulobacter sp. BK020]
MQIQAIYAALMTSDMVRAEGSMLGFSTGSPMIAPWTV